MEYINNR